MQGDHFAFYIRLCDIYIRLWDQNSNMVSFLQNIEFFVFSMMDVYPPKIDRMTNLRIPGDREFQRASFGTRFGCHSRCKTTSCFFFPEILKNQNSIFNITFLFIRTERSVRLITESARVLQD